MQTQASTVTIVLHQKPREGLSVRGDNVVEIRNGRCVSVREFNSQKAAKEYVRCIRVAQTAG